MAQVDIRSSFTAADSVPTKVLADQDIARATKEGVIPPIHVQFTPTNRCNLNCSFCSCSERTKGQEMDIDHARAMIALFAELGTKAVTITGGGEPLIHPHINEIIEEFVAHRIKVGFVTNGLLFDRVDPGVFNKVTWCRISHDDAREISGEYRTTLNNIVYSCPDVDWAFSYVASSEPNFDNIKDVVEFANACRFTHVRIVADLFHPADVPMDKIRDFLQGAGVNDSIVVYQGRKNPTPGGDCYICYLKPFVGADMKVYTCCGAQYALDPPSKDLPEELCLGSAFDMDRIIQESKKPFDGSVCKKCYYMNYNSLLTTMLSDVKHKEFV